MYDKKLFYEKLSQNINFTMSIKFSLFHYIYCVMFTYEVKYCDFLRVTFGLVYGMELVMNEFE